MGERTWSMAKNGKRPRGSSVPPWNGISINEKLYDPNNDLDKDAFIHWTSKGDYWTFKHVLLFDSWESLKEIVESTDFTDVSRKMLEQHSVYLRETQESWKRILQTS